MPGRFKQYSHEPWKSRNLRVMPVGNYLVFYIPLVESEEKGVVTVIRVIYGGRDVKQQLTRFTNFTP